MIRYALRSIARMPGLAAVVILSLGIGIGVNTAVFSWIQAIVLKPLPAVADATSFYSVEPKANTGTYPGVSWREYGDFKDRLSAFQDILAFRMVPFSVGESSRTERAYGMLVSGNYFSVLNLTPALGRFIEPREATQPGSEPVVVISHDYWQTHLAGRTDVVGQFDPRQRASARHHRCGARNLSGHDHRTAVRPVRARHHGACAARGIERARESQPPRLPGDGPPPSGRRRGPGANGAHVDDGGAGKDVSGQQRRHAGRREELCGARPEDRSA